MEKVQVLVADDHTVFCQGLVKLLDAEKDIIVVGKAANGRQAISRAKSLHPDVVLMDIEMPEVDGIEATRQIKVVSPTTEVVILTAYEDDEHLFQAIEAGASGYISKHGPIKEIAQAVRAVSRGESLLSPGLSRKILSKFAYLAKKQKALQEAGFSDFTKRELEILKLIAGAKTNLQIAQALFVSERTVKNHIYNIYRKLHCNSRIEATLKATELGLM